MSLECKDKSGEIMSPCAFCPKPIHGKISIESISEYQKYPNLSSVLNGAKIFVCKKHFKMHQRAFRILHESILKSIKEKIK